MAQDGVSTEPYKGVRDFYPDDMALLRYIFDTMGLVCERYGYQEYGASILEPTALYEAKSSQEIVTEQTYTFTDRGDRSVTLRPEMTPSVARMVAGKRRELPFPLRLYSIPNLFRYERPQRGRLREHWQLNVDLFGIAGLEAEVEIISLAYHLMKAFGAKEHDFIVKINSRALLNRVAHYYNIGEREKDTIISLLDKKDKREGGSFKQLLIEALGEKHELAETLLRFSSTDGIDALPEKLQESDEAKNLTELVTTLGTLGIKNAVIDTSIARGFDYYTGIVFEVFDTDPANKRSLFGGGRYDDLLSVFDVDPIPTIGFGMGDVTIRDFLETHQLLPNLNSKTTLSIALIDSEATLLAHEIAQQLRGEGINVVVDYSLKKIGDKIAAAGKAGIRYVLPLGSKEEETKEIVLKELETKKEYALPLSRLLPFLLEHS